MAIVGLSWFLATLLGALPFWLSGVHRGPAVRISDSNAIPLLYDDRFFGLQPWQPQPAVTRDQGVVLRALLQAGFQGLTEEQLIEQSQLKRSPEILEQLRSTNAMWESAIRKNTNHSSDPEQPRFQIRWIKATFIDALFESQSGFSTTGATVLSDLEDPRLVPRCILFWRSSTHFLGGLGIIVLFVAILGQGSAGKALMRAEMPGPNKEGTQTRMQQTAQIFAAIYGGLTILLTLLLYVEGLPLFDALCHAFGTMATGGFSTYNKSVGHFDSALIDYTIVVFMILAGTNFALLYAVCCFKPKKLFSNVEWRTYMGIILLATLLIVGLGLAYEHFETYSEAFRHGLFQVVAILTTTGFGTRDFDTWSNMGRAVLLLLMFCGGCAGSTGGGMKVIRHILFLKTLKLEVEQAFHPTVVRTLRLGGENIEGPGLRKSILVYFGLILVCFIFSWMAIVTFEPDATWGDTVEHKLIDSASAVASTLNNIGPGLGTVGATQNYGHFSWPSKLLFTWLMMVGRLEIFVILVLFWPRFWRSL
ncbi:MAG: potassium transporter [Planctomycetaceae bacterium]|nr:potassium transporter [Planctomycetaceae bacterium]MBP61523.1 potassium transporter [Planctomycetaceae bacterium]